MQHKLCEGCALNMGLFYILLDICSKLCYDDSGS